jgi:hypothetical protein
MEVYTIDELAKGREVSLKDYPGYRGRGRGPDKQKRKSKGTVSYFSSGKQITGFDYKQMKKQGAKGLSKISFDEAEENRRKAEKSSFAVRKPIESFINKSLTPQDEKNIDLIRAMVDKSPDLQKKLEGPIKWVGDVGWRECVAHLSKKKGITHAESLCGYLKGKARSKGQLKKEHMGSKERKQKK